MKKFRENTIREQLSTRGGGIEIDLTEFGYPNEGMTAYQNYLGGGMLGRVCTDCSVLDHLEDEKLVKLSQELAQYFHSLTNPSEDEWESLSYEQNQSLPISAY
jgi:hypothetical protein